jgi:hypothetical protein
MFPLSRNFLKFAAASAVVAFTYPLEGNLSSRGSWRLVQER